MKKHIIILFLVFGQLLHAQDTWFVDAGADGTNDGTSWTDAFTGLQAAINAASSGDEIWVAAGTYKPTAAADGSSVDPRDRAFVLKPNVKIYGGFAGTETELAQRVLNPAAPAILSGDFFDDDVVTGSGSTLAFNGNSDNAYHVVIASGDVGTTLLDGFTIKGGNADGMDTITVNSNTIFRRDGGGLYSLASSPTVSNCIFMENSASRLGGAIHSFSPVGAVTLTVANCTFTNNRAGSDGGAINSNLNSTADITDCTFSGNRAYSSGGAMVNVDLTILTAVNCTFDGNSADVSGGAIANGNNATTTLTGCTFDGNSAGSNGGAIINISNATTTLTDCTFTGNTANFGGAILSFSSPGSSSLTASNCTFDSNTAETSGGAINNNGNSTATFTECAFSGNTANGVGGAIVSISSTNTAILTASNCTFDSNTAETSGGAISNNNNSAATLTGCAFTGNTAEVSGGAIISFSPSGSGSLTVTKGIFENNSTPSGQGGAINNNQNSTAVITSCVFSDNTAALGGGGIISGSSSGAIISVVNSVFSGNTSTDIATARGGAFDNTALSTASVINCTFFNNTSSSHPDSGGGFMNRSTGSASISNSIFWGNTGGASAGNAGIVVGSGTVTATHSLVEGGFPGTGNINADPLFVNAISGDFHLPFDSPAVDAGNNAAIPPGITTDIEGNDRVQGTAVDMGAYESAPLVGERIYVHSTASGDGTSWADAFANLQDAIDAAVAGDEIWVAAGTYQPAIGESFSMKQGVKIYGGFVGTETELENRDWAANVTTLQGNGNSVIVNNNNGLTNVALLDGFTITGGNGGHGGGMYNVGVSPKINNCIFSGNTASGDGGGMCNHPDAAPIVTNCIFSGNTANAGGGMENSNATPTIVNCTFSGNKDNMGGGGLLNWAASHTYTVTVTNSIFHGNSTNILNLAGTLNITYSITDIINTGNVNANPLFIDAPSHTTAPFTGGDYRLQSGSPAIDAGDNAAIPSGITTDIEGNDRIQNSMVDMGAYESAPFFPPYPPELPAPQNIVAAQYFIDNGAPVAIPIVTPAVDLEDISFDADIDGLSNGGHKLYIRVLSEEGHWSIAAVRDFIVDFDPSYPPVPPAPQNIVAAEYFINNGTPVSIPIVTPAVSLEDINFDADIDGLSNGEHKLYVRVLSEEGHWSIAAVRDFIVDFDPSYPPVPPVPQNIVAAEYFINSGTLVSIPIATPAASIEDITFDADLAGLNVGVHKLYVRVLSEEGHWSIAAEKDFEINEGIPYPDAPAVPQNIVAAEYFINNEAPVTIPIATPAVNLEDISFDADIDGLGDGFHFLVVRTLSEEDRWSIAAVVVFHIGDLPVTWTVDNEWLNAVEPNIDLEVFIEGMLTVGEDFGSFSAKTLTIVSGGSLTIKEGNSVTVAEDITNNAEDLSFVVESGANLLQESATAINSGNITARRNTTPMYRLDATFWSSPVSGQNLKAFSPNTLNGRFWKFDPIANAYVGANPLVNDFEAAVGYVIQAPNDYPASDSEDAPLVFEGEFKGVPHNGNIGIGTVADAYNLIGNPYPSAIDGVLLATANPSLGTFYFWTHLSRPDIATGTYPAGNYASWTPGMGGVAAQADTEDDFIPNGMIQAGQGFFVMTTGEEVNFSNAIRTAEEGHFYFTQPERHRFWLNLHSENTSVMQAHNQILVGYVENATLGIDHQIDAKIMTYNGNAIYSLADDASTGSAVNLVIQGRPVPFDDIDIVPLGFKAVQPGIFLISISQMDGLFEEGQKIYIKDNRYGTTHDLTENGYRFFSPEGEFTERFEIVYPPSGEMSIDDLDFNDILIYGHDFKVFIHSKTRNIAGVEIYDLLGRKLYSENKIQAQYLEIPCETFGNQVLLVRVYTESGKVAVKRVVNR